MQTQPATETQPTPQPIVHLAPGEGEAIWFVDHLVVVKLRGAQVPYGVMEVSLGAGAHTPFHRHHGEDESFYVLSGQMTLFIEDQAPITANPGEFVHLPRGVAHGFHVEQGVTLLVLSDPQGFVEFTREAGVPAPRIELPPNTPPDFERLDRIARKYSIELMGPLPS